MEHELNLEGDIDEDVYEEKPGRENPGDYDSHTYHLTFDDADMDRETYRRVFEVFDDRDEFEFNGENPVKALNDEIESSENHPHGDIPEDWRAYNSGGEVYIEFEAPGATGRLWNEYGPVIALDEEAVFSAPADIIMRLTGEPVIESVKKITSQTDAPYLESDPEYVESGEGSSTVQTGSFRVPAEYTDQELEESVDAFVERISKVSELQEDLTEVAENHP